MMEPSGRSRPIPFAIPTITSVVILGIMSLMLSGCIRFAGQAGYFKETPRERTEKVVGFDTARMFEDEQAKGSVTT